MKSQEIMKQTLEELGLPHLEITVQGRFITIIVESSAHYISWYKALSDIATIQKIEFVFWRGGYVYQIFAEI